MRNGYWGSNGPKSFCAVMLFTYGVQLFLFYFVDDDPVIWKFTNPDITFYLSLICLTGCFFLFTYRAIHLKQWGLDTELLLKVSLLLAKAIRLLWFRFRRLHVYLFFVISLLWLNSGLSSYRYDGVSVSEKLSAQLLIGMLWKVFFLGDFWYHVMLRVSGSPNYEYKYKYLLNLSFLFTLTGTTSAVYLVVHSLFTYFPNSFVRLLKVSIKETVVRFNLRSIRWFIFAPAGIFLVVIAYHYGEIIKTKKQMTLSARFASSHEITFVKSFLVQRTSTAFYAHTHLLSKDPFDLQDYLDHLNIPISNFIYRLDVICGRVFDVPKPAIASLNRLNYTTISAGNIDETSGASPGLLPGFMYLLTPWLAIIAAAFVLAKFAILSSICLPRLTFIHHVFSLFIFYDLTNAFVLVFNPLDQVAIYFLYFLGINGLVYLRLCKRVGSQHIGYEQ